ncbi:acetyltransferase [Salisediminibacterium halotolerans]|uniref:Sugar O-acyltransferase, sialic acid O-acetyltransferase NeuD family n=1 Tax=Salisediminibacterium halotolerans TaxID=517425 RepID=A0A1H9QJC3_9BACI|nr:acetyltransferase [Salisediminibacterium haloalkalitolerans]SER59949.1 sugar O-acyltransferase, sialic acid O-acetyltransferase NeuD family [Salisediminibacterium haloalkalitolerans]
MKKPIYIIGSGGYSKQVIEILEETAGQQDWEIIGLIDDDYGKHGQEVLGYPVLGDVGWLKKQSFIEASSAVVAVGDGEQRKCIINDLKNVYWPNVIHPSALLSKHIEMGKGNVISAGVIINPDSSLGNFNNINIGCTLGHDVYFADYVTVMPNCSISGNVNINQFTTVGTGTAVIQGLSLGSGSIIGAGSSVIDHTDSYSVYVGSPAKKVKSLAEKIN